MVVPITSEAEWLLRLRDVATWEPANAPLLVVVPHPDDETLAAGGLIASQRAKGVDVTVVAVTDGEHAYQQNRGLASVRREEQNRALERLGVSPEKIVRLGLTDSGVAGQEKELIARLQPLIREGCQVLAPWPGDFHPDHEACGRAADIVARSVGAEFVSYFFWTWHRGTVETVSGMQLRRFELSAASTTAKREALACHASQLKHASEPPILPEELLWPARMPFEIFAV